MGWGMLALFYLLETFVEKDYVLFFFLVFNTTTFSGIKETLNKVYWTAVLNYTLRDYSELWMLLLNIMINYIFDYKLWWLSGIVLISVDTSYELWFHRAKMEYISLFYFYIKMNMTRKQYSTPFHYLVITLAEHRISKNMLLFLALENKYRLCYITQMFFHQLGKLD